MSEDLTQLDLVELLQKLEPIPEPAPLSLWPQTAGWIWLGLFLLILLILGVRRWLQCRRANAYRRAALAEIDSAGKDPVVIATILRRTALAAFPREQVAALHGESWLQFLDRSYGGQGFTQGPGRALTIAPYREDADAAGLQPLVIEWIKQHRVEPETRQ